jgi:CRP-like cAMP-binding protein
MMSLRDVQPADDGRRHGNNLLKAMRPADFALLKPHLQIIDSNAQEKFYNAGDNVETVYFPCDSSLVSFLVTNEDGRDVDTILIGREGAVGGIVSSGHLPAYAKIVVKFAGPFVRLKVAELEAAKDQSPALRNLFARYADCLVAQILQSTACNAIHSIEQRTAKWIIAAMERAGNAELPLTQEELAFMLGVGRSYASRVIQTFKSEGIVETRRGTLIVRDLPALQARACLCNESVKAHFENVLRGVYPEIET